MKKFDEQSSDYNYWEDVEIPEPEDIVMPTILAILGLASLLFALYDCYIDPNGYTKTYIEEAKLWHKH